MCPIWKSIEKCGIDKNVTLFVDAVKITGIIPEVYKICKIEEILTRQVPISFQLFKTSQLFKS